MAARFPAASLRVRDADPAHARDYVLRGSRRLDDRRLRRRTPTLTKLVSDARRRGSIGGARGGADGASGVRVCPLIEESEYVAAADAVETYETLVARCQLNAASCMGPFPAKRRGDDVHAQRVQLLVARR